MSYPINALIHKYYYNLIAIEHPSNNGEIHKNIVIFLGGLGDGITTVPYVRELAIELDKIGWGVVEILTTSSFSGWGTGSLVRDSFEITKAIRYFKSKVGGSKSKIVLLGHSTGCQQTMYYLTQQYDSDSNDINNRPKIDGAILQASVSDREAYVLLNGKQVYDDNLKIAKEWVEKGNGNYVLPPSFADTFFNTFINANRWVSLMSVRGDDDFFSSDLDEEDFKKTFGKVSTELLVAYSSKDQFVPPSVDKEALLLKWQSITDEKYWSKHSGIVNGATHELGKGSEGGAKEVLIGKVRSFLEDL